MASAQVVETSVTNNSPSQDSYHPDDLFQSSFVWIHLCENRTRQSYKELKIMEQRREGRTFRTRREIKQEEKAQESTEHKSKKLRREIQPR